MSDGIKTNFFYHVYINHANSVISHHVLRGEQDKISRASIEVEILKEIDKSNFPLEYRIAFITKVVSTNAFDIYWLGLRNKYSLSKYSITRLKADMDLLDEIESPDPLDSDSDEEDNSSTISNPTSDNFPRTSESPPSSPVVHPQTGGKSIDSLAATTTTTDSEHEESPEPELPPKPQPKPFVIPTDGTPWWSNPETNPITRYNGNPRPTYQPAPLTARRSSTPSSDSDSDSDSNTDSAGTERDLDELIKPYLTGEAFLRPSEPKAEPPPGAPVDTPADPPATKSPRKGKGGAAVASGSVPNTRKRKVRFDLPEDSDGPSTEDTVRASPAKKARTTRSTTTTSDAPTEDTVPATPVKRTRTTRSKTGAGDVPTEDTVPASPTKKGRTTRGTSAATRGASGTRGTTKSRGTGATRGGAGARKKPATRGKSPARGGGGGAKGGQKSEQA